MGLLGPKITILLDRPGPFRGGDVIGGRIVVKSDKSYDIHNIDIILRCTELVSTVVMEMSRTRKYRREIRNHNRLYSFRQTLFPSHMARSALEQPISWSNDYAKPVNTWGEQFKRGYTLPPGTHTFDFQVQVPDGPSSLDVNNLNNVRWVLTAKLFKGSILTTSTDASVDVQVHRNLALLYDPRLDEHAISINQLKIYLDGYKTSTKSVSGFFNNMRQSENEFKKKKEIQLVVNFPNTGLVQDPNPMNISIGLRSDALDLLILKSVRIKLTRRVLTTIIRRSLLRMNETEMYQSCIQLYHKKNIDKPFNEVIDLINDEIRSTRITGFQTDTYISKHFRVSYDLGVTVVVASQGNPDSGSKVKMHIPIIMQSCMADVIKADETTAPVLTKPFELDPNTLPAYERTPQSTTRIL